MTSTHVAHWACATLRHLTPLLTACALAPAWAANSGLAACADVGPAKVLLDKQGALESIAFDERGRLLFVDIVSSTLKRVDQAGAAPSTVASGLKFPGGIVVTGPHEAHVGTGNSPVNGLLPSLGGAGIAKVDLDTGTVTPVIRGLSMANGVVRAGDGTYYASDDLAKSLDRVLPDGTVQRGWLALNSNGLALSKDDKTLYVNQMLPGKILAVDRATSAIRVIAEAPPNRTWTWLDGLAIDDAGQLYVVAYWGGEIWRLDPRDASMCVLAEGLSLPSAVAVGKAGSGHAPGSVYVTTHSGRLIEVPNAVPAAR